MPNSTAKYTVRILLFSILIILAIARIWFIDIAQIPQNGMYPTLAPGKRFLIKKKPYSSPSDVKRGDIILFTMQEDGAPSLLIWRVVGLPGDEVKTDDQSLTIDGQPLKRDRLRKENEFEIYREHNGSAAYEIALGPTDAEPAPEISTNVPPAHFFVMGDNRRDARDSRYFGPIPFASIKGRTFKK
jgi:signal peptidase I